MFHLSKKTSAYIVGTVYLTTLVLGPVMGLIVVRSFTSHIEQRVNPSLLKCYYYCCTTVSGVCSHVFFFSWVKISLQLIKIFSQDDVHLILRASITIAQQTGAGGSCSG